MDGKKLVNIDASEATLTLEKPLLIFIDEFDQLFDKHTEIIYNLCEWCSSTNTHLIMITASNSRTSDIKDEKLVSRLVGSSLLFPHYSKNDMHEIFV